MNTTVETFLRNNNVDSNNYDYNYSIQNRSDINPILYRHYLPGDKKIKEISIADVLGYDYQDSPELNSNLLDNISHFFDAEGSGYQIRSLKMVEMERDEVVEWLKQISIQDRVCATECDDNKFVITSNGMHRYHVLRFHYLNELSQINSNDKEKIQELKDKYKIPIEVTETDYVKSYSYFILKTINSKLRIDVEYDENYCKTGNSELRLEDEKRILTDEELLDFLVRKIDRNREKIKDHLGKFDLYMERIPSFKRFLEENNIDLFSQEVTV